jgi:hypothetical protein
MLLPRLAFVASLAASVNALPSIPECGTEAHQSFIKSISITIPIEVHADHDQM